MRIVGQPSCRVNDMGALTFVKIKIIHYQCPAKMWSHRLWPKSL